MAEHLTVVIKNHKLKDEIQSPFYDSLQKLLSNYQFSSTQKGQQRTYHIGIDSNIQKQQLKNKIAQLTRHYDPNYQVSILNAQKQQPLSEQKNSSQIIPNLNQQFSNSLSKGINEIISKEIEFIQITQYKQQSSGEFELLEVQKQRKSSSSKSYQQIGANKQESQSIQGDKNHYQESLRQIRQIQQAMQFVQLAQKISSDKNLQQDKRNEQLDVKSGQCSNQKAQMRNKDKYNEKQTYIEQECNQSQQFKLTNERLMKYFSGKDDYTVVFQLNKSQNYQEDEAKRQQIKTNQSEYNENKERNSQIMNQKNEKQMIESEQTSQKQEKRNIQNELNETRQFLKQKQQFQKQMLQIQQKQQNLFEDDCFKSLALKDIDVISQITQNKIEQNEFNGKIQQQKAVHNQNHAVQKETHTIFNQKDDRSNTKNEQFKQKYTNIRTPSESIEQKQQSNKLTQGQTHYLNHNKTFKSRPKSYRSDQKFLNQQEQLQYFTNLKQSAIWASIILGGLFIYYFIVNA